MYLQWNLSILGNCQQISNKTMKNQSKNNNKSNEFHELIHYIDELIRYLYICHFSLSNTHISGLKRE